MLLYFGKSYNASIVAQRFVEVVCEKCGEKFHYHLLRAGTGNAEAPYMIGMADAQERAAIAAEQNASIKIETQTELVPCPKCQWVNQDLIEKFWRHHARMSWSVLFVATTIATFISIILAAKNVETVGNWLKAAPLVALVAVPSIFFFVERVRRSRYNLNRDYPMPPRVPPGTPPALAAHKIPATGEECFTLHPRHHDSVSPTTDWLFIRTGQLQLPDECCVCLGTADRHYSHTFKISPATELAAPLCQKCLRRIRIKWCLMTGLTLILALIFGKLVAMILPTKIDRVIVLACFACFFVWLILIAKLPNSIVCPYRLSVVDSERCIFKFKVKNRDYHARVVRYWLIREGYLPPEKNPT